MARQIGSKAGDAIGSSVLRGNVGAGTLTIRAHCGHFTFLPASPERTLRHLPQAEQAKVSAAPDSLGTRSDIRRLSSLLRYWNQTLWISGSGFSRGSTQVCATDPVGSQPP
jgi:hypothetical protein